jgi:DNA excision repair protein ERCC-5
MALASIGKAGTGSPISRSVSPPPEIQSVEKVEPLFTSWSDVDSDHIDDDLDPTVTAAIEESWQEQEERDLKAAIEASRVESHVTAFQSEGAGPSRPGNDPGWEEEEEDGEDALLELPVTPPGKRNGKLESHSTGIINGAIRITDGGASYHMTVSDVVPIPEDRPRAGSSNSSINSVAKKETLRAAMIDTSRFFSPSPPESPKLPSINARIIPPSMVSVPVDKPSTLALLPSTRPPGNPAMATLHTEDNDITGGRSDQARVDMEDDEEGDDDMEEVDLGLNAGHLASAIVVDSSPKPCRTEEPETNAIPQTMEVDEEFYEDWSRSPSPGNRASPRTAEASNPEALDDGDNANVEMERDWDAAQEVDVEGEAGEFARFISQVKGKDLDTVRDEIEQEIKELHKAKKNHQRDSEEITQQMVAQIMVRASPCKVMCY